MNGVDEGIFDVSPTSNRVEDLNYLLGVTASCSWLRQEYREETHDVFYVGLWLSARNLYYARDRSVTTQEVRFLLLFNCQLSLLTARTHALKLNQNLRLQKEY